MASPVRKAAFSLPFLFLPLVANFPANTSPDIKEDRDCIYILKNKKVTGQICNSHSISSLEKKLASAPPVKNVNLIDFKTAVKMNFFYREKGKDYIGQLIQEHCPGINGDEKLILLNAPKNWPLLKFHALRIVGKDDAPLVYRNTLAESKFYHKNGKDGEKSIMQLTPKTAIYLRDKYGLKDPFYIKSLHWTHPENAYILACYYTKEGLKKTGCLGKGYNQLSPKEHFSNYKHYNGTSDKKRTQQLVNYTKSGDYMWTLEIVEKWMSNAEKEIVKIAKKDLRN